jgi:hypothetical protein
VCRDDRRCSSGCTCGYGPIRAAAEEAEHVYELERVGESEWTPWIALAALIVFFAVIGLLMFGLVETGSHLLASATSER